jgi:hypothetical protein
MHGVSNKYQEEDSEGSFEPPYIISFKSCLSQSQKKMVEEKVRAIQCDVPIYVAIMNKCSVKIRYELVSFFIFYELLLLLLFMAH